MPGARIRAGGLEINDVMPEDDEIVKALRGRLWTVADAHRLPSDGGLPERSGLYVVDATGSSPQH